MAVSFDLAPSPSDCHALNYQFLVTTSEVFKACFTHRTCLHREAVTAAAPLLRAAPSSRYPIQTPSLGTKKDKCRVLQAPEVSPAEMPGKCA